MIKKLLPILFASFFFSFHLALLSYVNSSMLGQIIAARSIGFVYMISSALSLCMVFYAPHAVKRYGNLKYMSTVLSICLTLLLLLGIAGSSWIIVPLFILYFSLISLIYYGFDVFLERFTRLGSTGNTRGMYLTLGNLAWIAAPALVGSITARTGYSIVYLLAAATIAVVLSIILSRERGFHDTSYGPTTFKSIVQSLRQNSDIRDIIILQGMLQFFYVLMVIYVPLYLKDTLGFGWKTIGMILSVMLLPFILFQYTTGKIADRYFNEREIIFGGFIVMAFATLFFSTLGVTSVLIIAFALFLTRVGASIAEVAIESYFFKKVQVRDIELISVYRTMMPIAYVIAPFVAIIILRVGTYQTLFATLGVILCFVALFSLFLHDIKKEK